MQKISFYFLVLVSLVYCSPKKQMEITYETDNTNFFNGQILLPDYVHTDTLIVKDAKFLNYCMEHYNAGSDGDISDILRVTTTKK